VRRRRCRPAYPLGDFQMSFDDDLFDARHRPRLGAFVRRAYASVFSDLGRFVDQNVFWLLAFFVTVECLDLYLADTAKQAAASLTGSLFASGIAVGWHRYVLLGEERSPLAALRFGTREGRFWLLSLTFAAATLLFAVALSFTAVFVRAALPPGGIFLVIVGSAVALGLGAFLTARLSLAFPLIALEERAPLRTAWAASRMHGWFIFKLMFVTTLPMVVVIQASRWIGLQLAPTAGPYIRMAFALLSDGFWVAAVCIGAAAISLAARALLGNARDVTA